MTESLYALVVRNCVATYMADARAAKAKGRRDAVAYYVKQARRAHRDGRTGRFELMTFTVM